jgi:cytochrome c-type biogenesis protein CcmH
MALRPLGKTRQGRCSFRNFAFGFVVVLLAFLVLSVETASAKSWGYDLAAELMSPYCPGRTLASCPSPQAAELVQWMVLQEAAGSSKEEVVAILIERFGEEILGAPPAKGITLWAYIFPVLGFVVLGGFAVLVLRRIVAGDRIPADAVAPAPSIVPGQTDAAGSGSIDSERAVLAEDELARMVDADLAARGL